MSIKRLKLLSLSFDGANNQSNEHSPHHALSFKSTNHSSNEGVRSLALSIQVSNKPSNERSFHPALSFKSTNHPSNETLRFLAISIQVSNINFLASSLKVSNVRSMNVAVVCPSLEGSNNPSFKHFPSFELSFEISNNTQSP